MVSKQKILIVDDDNNIAELIALYLTKECFETKIVNDGEEALREFASFRPGKSSLLGKFKKAEGNENTIGICAQKLPSSHLLPS